MRITRDFLLRTAATQASFIAYNDPSVVCIFLVGSCLHDEPLLGGSADVDLIAVHSTKPKIARVVARLNDEISIDIAHFSRAVFDQPRSLRLDPWLGAHLIASPKVLHDRTHWFEFTQAAIAPRYYASETVAQRAQSIAQAARFTWMRLSDNPECTPQTVSDYLFNIKRMAVYTATYSAPPAADRRLWLDHPSRAQNLNRSNGSSLDLAELFLPENPAEVFMRHLAQWTQSLEEISRMPASPPWLTIYRKAYYADAAQSLLEENPAASLWIMLSTWSSAVLWLRANSKLHTPFAALCQYIGLIGEEYPERLRSMDSALDRLEAHLDQFCISNGISLPT